MSDATRLPARLYLQLSLRNLWRNPRRTLITLSVMIFGIATLTLLGALNDGWLEQMRTNFILSFTGHVQVHAQGFEASQNLADHIELPEEVTSLMSSIIEIQSWTQRIRSSGLISRGGNSAGVQIMAIDPEQETWVTHMHESVVQGRWLNPGMAHDLLLGATVAQNIGAKLGDRVVLMSQTASGKMVSEIFFLRGVIESGAPQIDRTLALIPLDSTQLWLGMPGVVTDIVIRAQQHQDTDRIRRILRQLLSEQDYEILTWKALDPMVRQWLDFSDAYGLVIILVVALLVLVEILNTMLIALHERQKELAIMLAVGTHRRQIFAMLLLEAVMLILFGSLLGYLVGGAVVFALADQGVDLSAYANAFQFFYMDPVIVPNLSTESTRRILGTTLIASLVAGIYPAWQATRIQLSQSLRIQ
ncbi:ABC transporter permease [Candidatus Endoriftia persephone str. Guaymas]|nr:ABC transporter permease [Candidatus Endoriftia persephone str. Guaymas]